MHIVMENLYTKFHLIKDTGIVEMSIYNITVAPPVAPPVGSIEESIKCIRPRQKFGNQFIAQSMQQLKGAKKCMEHEIIKRRTKDKKNNVWLLHSSHTIISKEQR